MIGIKHIGHIDSPGSLQMPIVHNKEIWCSIRDDDRSSKPYFVGKLQKANPLIIKHRDKVITSIPTKAGSPFRAGIMPSCIDADDNMWVIGWSFGTDKDTKYKACIGVSTYFDSTHIDKPYLVMDRDDNEIGCTSPFVVGSTMYYVSYQSWHKKEPVSIIRSCDWIETPSGVYNFSNFQDILKGMYCYARPILFEDQLWFSYREYGEKNYKAGCLRLIEGNWIPEYITADDRIVAYPYPFRLDDTVYVMYNNTEGPDGTIQIGEVVYA